MTSESIAETASRHAVGRAAKLYRGQLLSILIKELRALAMQKVGPYQLQAAIAAVHAEAATAEETRWTEIAALYDRLCGLSGNPVHALNRAVAISFFMSPIRGLRALAEIENEVSGYQPFYAAQADMLRRAGLVAQAHEAYEHAIALSANVAEREYLLKQQATLKRPV